MPFLLPSARLGFWCLSRGSLNTTSAFFLNDCISWTLGVQRVPWEQCGEDKVSQPAFLWIFCPFQPQQFPMKKGFCCQKKNVWILHLDSRKEVFWSLPNSINFSSLFLDPKTEMFFQTWVKDSKSEMSQNYFLFLFWHSKFVQLIFQPGVWRPSADHISAIS